MKKIETISEKLKKVREKQSLTAIADLYGTNLQYVSQIARGVRKPTRGKGLKIKQELEKLINQ
ncbi:XRE family transcriptional regulator [Ornithobacterium rhinotracheale]|uniref:XRE family transcriptional regulator n=1 Tax=Ornithobacterium rhinotracheale TaxID=28251 RepID=UPI0040375B68